MKWLFVFMAVFGYLLNIDGKLKCSYIVWLVSNTCWAIYFLTKKEYESFLMFLIYDLLCVYSLRKQWKR